MYMKGKYNMNRITEAKEHYKQSVKEVCDNKELFTDFVRFAGRFYKIDTSHLISIYHQNPEAELLADYNTWNRFGRQVKLGEKSIAVINSSGKLNHYFDISQTGGDERPYQWTIDKEIANSLSKQIGKENTVELKSLTQCIEHLSSEALKNRIKQYALDLGIKNSEFNVFVKSFQSIVCETVAARCSINSKYNYKGSLDLTAYDLVKKSGDENVIRLLTYTSGISKMVLREIERNIQNIQNERGYSNDGQTKQSTKDDKRTGVPLGRNEQPVAAARDRGERDDIPSEPGDVSLRSDDDLLEQSRGDGNARGASGSVRSEVDGLHDGEPSRRRDTTKARVPMGNTGSADRLGSVGDVREAGDRVQEAVPKTDDIYGNPKMGDDEGPAHTARDNGADSAATQSINETTEQLTLGIEGNDNIERFSFSEIIETEIEIEKPQNYRITDYNLGHGGQKVKYQNNVAAIKLLKELETENRQVNSEEQEILSKYVGWGGVPEVFDDNKVDFSNEYTELKRLLNDDEYAAARASTMNAHYTSPEVIRAMYKAIEGMIPSNNGRRLNIIEPSMGVGNFFGMLPNTLSDSNLTGVELDSITGRIARQLYPNADISITGFEKKNFEDNSFDIAIGNVPFGNYSLMDKKYNTNNFLIHDYFFAKSLDLVAPGGVVAFITSKGTLDKQNSKVREYLAERADLVGAIRLPNTAFKANANTEVTADIIFLQKREIPPEKLPDWCYTLPLENGDKERSHSINSYFMDNPHMVLGEMKLESSRYGFETTCSPIPGAVLSEQLESAIKHINATIKLNKNIKANEAKQGIIPAVLTIRNYTYGLSDGKLYYRENDKMTLVNATGKKLEQMLSLHNLRCKLRELIDEQVNDCDDEQLRKLQGELVVIYDNYVKKYGYINNSDSKKVFGEDDDYNTLCSLEVVDEETKTVTKADIFSSRTIRPTVIITHADDINEAYQISLDRMGCVDIPYIAELLDKDETSVLSELIQNDMVYRNPFTASNDNPFSGYETTSEYLSGNVREKLSIAKVFALNNTDYERNVLALEKVIPKNIEAQDISVRIGASWVDTADYVSFLRNLSGRFQPSDRVTRTYTGEYKITDRGSDRGNAATVLYGTERMNLYYIFENLLNQRDIVVRDKVIDAHGNETYVINKKETQLAMEKARIIKENFSKWLWSDQERRKKYVTRYNELFNSIVGRKYDGSHQTFPGMSPNIELREHQKNAIARAKYGGNTLLAHCVGAGKSFEMVAAVMEKKRLGLINKACMVVPKALTGQTAIEWQRLYPNARVLVASEKDFQKENRQKFMARCVTGNYDGIVMSYEQFEKISMSLEYKEKFIRDELDKIGLAIKDCNKNDRSSVKQLERVKKQLEVRLNKLLDGGKTKDTSLNFEQFGFDYLVVDEAHNYKNGLVTTKMSNVSGISSAPAQKSEDMLMKCNFLNEKYGCKNMLFATGTPVSNSMTELYIMKNYLRPDLLKKAGLQTFDDWASAFGEVVSQLELKPAGNGFRTKKRFAKFVNLPELMSMYKEFADIQTADNLKLPVPELESGKPQTVVAKPTEFQKSYMQELASRSEAVHSGSVDPHEDNMLKITNEARLLGLDERTIEPTLDFEPGSKINLCIENVLDIYKKTDNEKGVQAIFCDIAINNDSGRFSAYESIKSELVKVGIPENEISFAGDAKDTRQRNELFSKIRSGEKRVVIASTSKMGTGANIQTRLAALHHLDIPWRPSDLEQRNGRIIRQGNTFDKVSVFNYVTEGTFDAYMMNIITTKQKFISQLMNGNSSARTCEDVDEMVLNYSEMQALATGDPRIKERIELGNKISELRVLESAHFANIYKMQDEIKKLPSEINLLKENLEKAGNDKAFSQSNNTTTDMVMQINGVVYDNGVSETARKDADNEILKEVLLAKNAADKFNNNTEVYSKVIGNYKGFEVGVCAKRYFFDTQCNIFIKNNLNYQAEAGINESSRNTTRIENLVLSEIDRRINGITANITQKEKDLAVAEQSIDMPFERADELKNSVNRMAELDDYFTSKDEVCADEQDISNDEVEQVETKSVKQNRSR